MLKMNKSDQTLAELIKSARKEKGLSARKLASLLNISHTEINNMESGIRIKPSIIVLKGLEQYLDIPFKESAKLAGYSKETIEYGEEEIIVSYEMYDKKIRDMKDEVKHAEYIIDQKRHLAMDIEDYFKDIHEYLRKQDNVDKDLLNKANSIDKFLSEIEKKYESISKEK
ncbi:MAG: helix-turn-helix transcriptional regulator [Bacilli bacterium]|nr:helix-turn-helix transcriptional regulator [Bacilli bacterium]